MTIGTEDKEGTYSVSDYAILGNWNTKKCILIVGFLRSGMLIASYQHCGVPPQL